MRRDQQSGNRKNHNAKTEILEALQWNRRRFASFRPIKEERCAAKRKCNLFDFTFVFRRFDKQDVRARFAVEMSAFESPVETLDSSRVRSGNDCKI